MIKIAFVLTVCLFNKSRTGKLYLMLLLLLFQIQPSLISQLKTVRQLAISRLMEFFEKMTDYDFKPICEGIFSSAVWPQVNYTSASLVCSLTNPRMFDEVI